MSIRKRRAKSNLRKYRKTYPKATWMKCGRFLAQPFNRKAAYRYG